MVKVLGSLFVILFFNKLFNQLGLASILGTLVLAVWSGHSFRVIGAIAWGRIWSLDMFFLMGIIFQVVWLSAQMEKTGSMKELVFAVRARISQRHALAVLPAVIGLLPMPGGAIFSAPLVDDCDHDKSLPAILKTKINYWFRHIWEYWWPLYPGVLLARDLTGIPMSKFMALQISLSIFAVIAGYFFLLRGTGSTEIHEDAAAQAAKGDRFLKLVLPIIIVIGTYIVLKFICPDLARISEYLPMIIGLVIAMALLQFQRPLPVQEWRDILFSRKTIAMAAIVLFIRVYGAFLEARLPDGSLLMDSMRNELYAWGIPVVLVIMLVPFIAGFTSGLAIGFVGASFPIVMAVLGAHPSTRELMATTVLAYCSGYMGMILSPVHVCLIVSNQHFNTRLADSIVQLIKPALAMLSGGVLLYCAIRFV
ncbi:MAG: hypothetical protein A2268_16105 [Candidatus Raymondbacteria bacterium RifOxyA12_full_50_37]|uniref:DUF401 family protein n=1 Tax=Candidatus Raymondbacteria bacterium RIFOXYD12_FULL_49_13 TaxID=1817890 RepID=A0A1F7FBR5_UNCRA|nr:MAG: hypothetical protein A2268_16105 [Candidatus Raymondbacteria bacterium RifOxyA12_full_50_37]OGJ94385.1 MAG: hypothetical protein A2248_14300 [Candidatus Raymondbacteria bacterium RIFOXYA2_FULL_49_16]OGJ94507.1 MAG: hypothetical protein A2350_07915 [Candidatus Raymondbacteria bacterium RifOxyB12_full_50_8]OGJ95327.1 MAG: hypothetical protein A2453_05725 [Candidatus Raymondbacteria bacterium RIFOXYC2_FULL_50_21]OGK04125.1 MAG: hypothetical protein A2519_19570 [Candidatus Raymondbacteria b